MTLMSRAWGEDGDRHGSLGYLRFMDLETIFRSPTYADTRALHLVNYIDEGPGCADISTSGLLLEPLHEGDSTAEVLQCILMDVLASRYQNYQFIAGGNHTRSQRADFSLIQVPGGHGRPAPLPAGVM